ncbi:PAS domain S-box protein [uncultured Campylobacter sp.]|uniref:PAS domain-containing sensor histidine kinase n=1 Tax=uncultured Campylobacter sp. TaxID=218934 RepID=UPI00260C9C10|nr:PAS domain S-box protein [uncultured Campylobacter sp.]
MVSDALRLKQYKDVIEANNIVSKTDPQGIITFVNDEFCKISGYSKEELIGSNHNIIRHPDVSKETFKKLWETILSKKVYRGIVKNRAKDGTAFYLNATIIPILDENGDIEEFIAIRHNITEVVRLNERLIKIKTELKELNAKLEKRVREQTKELLELNKSLEKRIKSEVKKSEEKNRIMFRQSRLASMGEMIANIAHQWRQPLNELSIVLFNLKSQRDDEDKFAQSYDKSKHIIKNMSKTIDDFSNFFNSNKGKDYFLVSQPIEDSIAMLSATLQKENIELEVNLEEEATVYGIRSELMQVIINLIGNAKDALKKDKVSQKIIKISTKIVKNHEKEFVYIGISDNAKAIKKELIDKIFEPYFTTKHQNIGTGLGLYMSKMIIDSMNGEIDIDNKKNCVTFIIKLPIIKEYGNE